MKKWLDKYSPKKAQTGIRKKYLPEKVENWVEPKYVAGQNPEGHYGYSDGTIWYDPNSEIENINTPWWAGHEKYHHYQSISGRDTKERRDSELNAELDKMIKSNPQLQFVPRSTLIRGSKSFPGAEERMYENPSTIEGEARLYEEYIERGGKSIFPQKKNGGIEGTMGGLTDIPFKYNSAWGGQFKDGGDKKKSKKIDKLFPDFKSELSKLPVKQQPQLKSSTKPIDKNKKSSKKVDPVLFQMDREKEKVDRENSPERRANRYLGYPMTKAADAAERLSDSGDDPVDNFRHPMAGRYTAEAIAEKFPKWMQYTPIPKAAGFIGANAFGIGHELASPAFNEGYSWYDTIREGAEDAFNNFVGSAVGSLPLISDEQKTKTLQYLSENNLLPDGVAQKHNMYFKRNGGKLMTGGSLPGSVGFMYARTAGAAPSNGPYAKKTKASAKNGSMTYYQHGLDFKPRMISQDGSQIPSEQEYLNDMFYEGLTEDPEAYQYPGRIQDPAKRDAQMRNIFFTLMDQYKDPYLVEAVMREQNQSYGSDRLENHTLNDYYGYDYNDIQPENLLSYYQDYMEEYEPIEKQKNGGSSDPGPSALKTWWKKEKQDYLDYYNKLNPGQEKRSDDYYDEYFGEVIRPSVPQYEVSDPYWHITPINYPKGVEMKLSGENYEDAVDWKTRQKIKEGKYKAELVPNKSLETSVEDVNLMSQLVRSLGQEAVRKGELNPDAPLVKKNGGWLEKYTPKAQTGIEQSWQIDPRELARQNQGTSTDAATLAKMKADAQAAEIARRRKLAAKESSVGPARKSTAYDEQMRAIKNRTYQAQNAPYTNIDEQGNLSRAIPNVSMTGVPDARTPEERFQKGLTHLENAAIAADVVGGIGSLLGKGTVKGLTALDAIESVSKKTVEENVIDILNNLGIDAQMYKEKPRGYGDMITDMIESENELAGFNEKVKEVKKLHSDLSDIYNEHVNVLGKDPEDIDPTGEIKLFLDNPEKQIYESMGFDTDPKSNYLIASGMTGDYTDAMINSNLTEGGRALLGERGEGIFRKPADDFGNFEQVKPWEIFDKNLFIRKNKKGGVIKDDMGQWAHPGEITEIGSNDITMEGVPYPVLGISDEGDTKLMQPGKKYKFKGKKVTEYPMKNGGWLSKYK